MEKTSLVLASDHAGYPAKKLIIDYLNSLQKFEIVDCGCHDITSVDYPDNGKKFNEDFLANKKKNEKTKGLVFCGSGIGISISVNRNPNINCVLVHNEKEVRTAMELCDVDVLSFGGKILDSETIKKLVDIFLEI